VPGAGRAPPAAQEQEDDMTLVLVRVTQ
jgi:hypothetical protein